MSRLRSARWRAVRMAMFGIMAWAATAASAVAQETVNIVLPAAVSFPVTDVSRSTSGAPNTTTISFSNANLMSGKALRISVKADAAAFTPPGGSSIPASKVSWTASGAGGGGAGTLSSFSDTLVYQNTPLTTSGQVDLAWTLAAPGSGIRAGNHQLTIRWKVESIMP